VYLIDDDVAMRDSLSFLLQTCGRRVESFESPSAFLQAAVNFQTGCVITDVRMPEMSGMQLVRKLKDLGVRLPIIMITGHADVPIAVEAMKAGVVDFIEKPFSDDVIIAAVDNAVALTAEQVDSDESRQAMLRLISTLTERERQVFERVVTGESNNVVAQSLGISPRTVDIYRANVMTKLRASNLPDLVRMAIVAGLT
jgi:two-component system response regulator FixJ